MDWIILSLLYSGVISVVLYFNFSRHPERASNPLTELLYCADCGSKLTHRQPTPGKEKIYDSDDSYICGSYRQLTHDCTMHFIKTSVVKDLILTAIHKVSTYVMEDEERFTERVRKTTEVQQEESIKEYRRQILKAQKRVKELDGLIKKLYEGNATGKIPDKHFERMLADYDTEQTALENLIFKLQPKVAEYTLESVKVEKFIEIVKKYTDFSELTTPMLNEFIEKVVVYEADKSTGDRRQKVDVYFNFIGKFSPPEEPLVLSAEQKGAELKALKQGNREREQNKLHMRRVRERQRATGSV